MTARFRRVLAGAIFIACAQPSLAQVVVGADSPSQRYNRLRDSASRGPTTIEPARPDAFGTATVNAGVTFYDARFRRVAAADSEHPLVVALADELRGLSPMDQLAKVHSAVNQRVRWAHDLDTVKVGDLWANAGETLERGAGDSEDIAIVKMQALKAAGYNPRDLYITIGRHRSAGSHIVLLARTPEGMIVLDDKAASPQSAALHGQFTPVLTLGQGKSWVHGRRVHSVAARSAAQ